MATRKRVARDPSMPDQHKAGRRGCQSRCTGVFVKRRRAAAFGRREFLFAAVVPLAYRLGTPPAAAAAPLDQAAGDSTADHVRATAERISADTILITLRIDAGYHVNANPASERHLIPTRVSFTGATPRQVLYPPSLRFSTLFTPEPIVVYEGSVVITARFAPGALARIAYLRITVTAQACTEKICLPPSDIPVTIG